MIWLAASAWATTYEVCNPQATCAYGVLDVALAAAASDPNGPHQIDVSGVHTLNGVYAFSQPVTIAGGADANLAVGNNARFTVNSGQQLTVSGFGIGFLPGRATRLFEANGSLTLSDVVFGDITVDQDGALVYVNGSGSAQLTNVDIAPSIGALFFSKSAFYVNGGGTLDIDGSDIDLLSFTNGHLFEVNGGTVEATDLVVTSAISVDRGPIGRVYSSGSLTIDGGSLGSSAITSSITSVGDGGLFRVEASDLTLRNLSIQSVLAGSGGVVWANGGSALDFENVDVSSVFVTGHGGLIEQSAGTLTWAGGVVSSISSNDGGALALGGSSQVSGVAFSSMVGVSGPALVEASAPLTLEMIDVVAPVGADAAIHTTSELHLSESNFTGGSAPEAAYLWAEGSGALTLTDTRFEGGDCTAPSATAGATAVVIEANRSAVISGSTFDHNGTSTSPCLGALLLDADAELSGTTFVGNQALVVGAIELGAAAALFQGAARNTFTHNGGSDGAVRLNSAAGLGTETHPFVADFSANTGGAIHLFGADAYLFDSSFTGHVSARGGAIDALGTSNLTITDSTFTSNQATAEDGGAIYAFSSGLSLTGCDFSTNSAARHGGAVYADVDGSTIDACTFTQNSAVSNGGAVLFDQASTVTDSTFTENSVVNNGGAIGGFTASELVLERTELRGNHADNVGSAVFLSGDSTVTAVDDIFSLNTSNGNRGALHLNANGTLDVQRSLFCGNTAATHGAAIFAITARESNLQHNWFAQHTEIPVYLATVDGDASITQSTFWGPGTSLLVTDGDEDVEVQIERSLFGGFQVNDRPVRFDDFDVGDTVVFSDSMLAPTGYLEPSGSGVTVSNLIDEDPALVEPQVDCALATLEDFAAGPLSPAWTRDDPLDHWGAYLPDWGLNHDQDPSPALWDCADGDYDADAGVHREADEVCLDGLDQDCDGVADDGCTVLYYPDEDGDLFGDAGHPGDEVPGVGWVEDHSDCDDHDAAVNPDAAEVCNGIDDNCVDGVDETFTYVDIIVDLDGDSHGVTAQGCPGTGLALPDDDCDDTNASIHPGAVDICGNGRDENCSGEADETSTWYADVDGDGYGDAHAATESCDPPTGHVDDDSDCDDTLSTVFPGAPEACNGLDDDCNGLADDGLPQLTSYFDGDADGFAADDAVPVVDCQIPASHTQDLGDCDDQDPTTYTGAQELCDAIDHDCDGLEDPVGTPTWYPDLDGDGFGAGTGEQDCTQPPQTAGNDQDCDDGDPAVNPAAPEVCDGVDNNCADGVDEGLPVLDWYADADQDGYGTGASIPSCDGLQAPGRVPVDGDCNDQNPQLSPGEHEICDQIDNDCDGNIDDQDDDVVGATVFYLFDDDGDGWGEVAPPPACVVPPNALSLGPDCDDDDPVVYPTAPENCFDGIDNDCDGLIDDADPDFVDGTLTYWADQDGDGYGDPNNSLDLCGLQPGYVLGDAQLPDCDDALFGVNPAAEEVCDGVDNNCNGHIDGADTDPPPSDGVLLYTDSDGDGFGAGLLLLRTCDASQPLPDTSVDPGDCDDDAIDVNPGATEDCSDVDRDCSGDAYDADAVRYLDADGDGFGDPLTEAPGCFPDDPTRIEDASDCDDSSASIAPDAPELCDPVDQDCDGDPWQGQPVQWLVDRDCDEVPGSVEAACNPADLPNLGACDPVPDDGSDADDCDDLDPDVQVCESESPIKRVPATGCGCDSGASGSWLGLWLLAYGVRKRRTRRERLVG